MSERRNKSVSWNLHVDSEIKWPKLKNHEVTSKTTGNDSYRSMLKSKIKVITSILVVLKLTEVYHGT